MNYSLIFSFSNLFINFILALQMLTKGIKTQFLLLYTYSTNMNVKVVVASILVLIFLIIGSIFAFSGDHGDKVIGKQGSIPSQAKREIIQYPINPKSTLSVNARNIPEFVVDASSGKFANIISASKEKIKELVSVKIISQVKAEELTAEIIPDKEKKLLLVKPEQLANFKPGLYKISLTMRTLEGEVDLEQDFTWGVIAVNTKKSVYRQGEKVQIGFGVLDDAGQTQCLGGFDHVTDLSMIITSPDGRKTNYSIKDNSIKDSGKCAATSVTNEADFQAEFLDSKTSGVYQMTVTANVKGKIRSITDYFKVDSSVKFDVERTSFPTRIYPFAPYPATSKITAKEDFTGEVTDIVPAFFDLANISNGGVVEIDGDYKIVKWKVSLKKNQPQEFTYFIKFPPVSPEFYLVGPIKVGDFTEARQWQIASDAINSTSGVVSYEDNGASATWSRVWTGTAFNAQANMDVTGDVPDDSRWFREVSSPKTGEKLVAAYDNAGAPINDQAIWMYRWTGSAWIEDFVIAVSTPDTNTRVMDISYEELSGDALFVFGDSTTQLKYRTRIAGTWSGTLNAGTGMDSIKRWVRAKPQFGSDTILVGYLNSNERIGALIWDGSTKTFSNQFDDDDSPAQTETISSDEEAFDIAWETQSNTPMIFWGTAANTVLSREFSSGAWQSENTVYNTGFTGDIEWISASADPVSTSNYIALAMQESDSDTTNEVSDCEFGVWDGSAGVTRPTAVSCRGDFVGRLNSVAFENAGSRAVWFYVPSESGTTGNTPAYRTWTNGGGFTSSSALSGNLSGNIESVQLYADLNTQSMIALTCDSAGDLNHFEWDGTSWTAVATDLHSNIQNSAEDAEAYGFGFDRNLEQQVAYRWFDNSGTVAVSSAIGAQDSPALLTSANQQFRLRLLLYNTDTLTASLRNYKLQYVDPGLGTCSSPSSGTPATWTDVPSSGGSTISFYNNATPADGDNLTVNGSLDPAYLGLTIRAQDYEEANDFTNSVSAIAAETEVGLWDFSLIDNTTFDRVAQTYCFRVARTSNVVLQIGVYPQISTASVDDVLIQGGSQIDQGTAVNNE